jgi:hypothetical protein
MTHTPQDQPAMKKGTHLLCKKLVRAVFSPGGAAVNSQGRQPLGQEPSNTSLAPEGRHKVAPRGLCRPSGAKEPGLATLPGVSPLAIYCRPSGAEDLASTSFLQSKLRPLFHGVWLTLLGLFIVCHGCHGDEDNELCLTAASKPHTQAVLPMEARGE